MVIVINIFLCSPKGALPLTFQIHADTAGQVRRGPAPLGPARLLPGQHPAHLPPPGGHPPHRKGELDVLMQQAQFDVQTSQDFAHVYLASELRGFFFANFSL